MGHIQRERLPKSKMASSDDRFTLEIVRVLRFGNELNKELCCRFILTNLQQSLDLQVLRCDQKFQSPNWRLILRIWSPKRKIQSHWRLYQAQFYALVMQQAQYASAISQSLSKHRETTRNFLPNSGLPPQQFQELTLIMTLFLL